MMGLDAAQRPTIFCPAQQNRKIAQKSSVLPRHPGRTTHLAPANRENGDIDGGKALKTLNFSALSAIASSSGYLNVAAAAGNSEHEQSRLIFSSDDPDESKPNLEKYYNIYIKGPKKAPPSSSSVSMPMSSMKRSIVGKLFYKKVTTREAEDGIGWSVMLDYRTLKTPSKRNLKLPTLALAKATAAEWEYQQTNGIRPFTMSPMKFACTTLERVPVTRPKIIEHLMKKIHQDLIFCRAPGDNDLTEVL